MKPFMNPEVIAGIILAFYFFARAATSLMDRKTGVEKKVIVAAQEYEFSKLKHDVDCIKKRVEQWDDRIQSGDFSCKWTDREVYEVLEVMKRIDRNLL